MSLYNQKTQNYSNVDLFKFMTAIGSIYLFLSSVKSEKSLFVLYICIE